MNYDETLRQIHTLIKAKRYQEALDLTVALKGEHWNDGYLHRLIKGITPQLRKQEAQRQHQFIKAGLRTINVLKKEEKFEEAIKACREILEVDRQNRQAIHLLQICKEEFINQKLEDPIQKKWLEEKKYEKLYLFYQKLRKIFPDHPQLQERMKKAEKKLLEKDRNTKKKFEMESLKRLREMFAQGYYELVIMGAEDLIRFTHKGSPEAEELLEEAQHANRSEIERDIDAYMERQIPLLKATYEAGEESMIRI